MYRHSRGGVFPIGKRGSGIFGSYSVQTFLVAKLPHRASPWRGWTAGSRVSGHPDQLQVRLHRCGHRGAWRDVGRRSGHGAEETSGGRHLVPRRIPAYEQRERAASKIEETRPGRAGNEELEQATFGQLHGSGCREWKGSAVVGRRVGFAAFEENEGYRAWIRERSHCHYGLRGNGASNVDAATFRRGRDP